MKKSDNNFANNHYKTWVIIPAFNEELSIGSVLDELDGKGFNVLVVDDCSTDRTAEVALEHGIVLLKHTINLGQGAALQTGFDYVLQKTDAEYVVTFDSDGQHNADDIPAILEPLQSKSFEVTLGSRFIKQNLVSGITKSKLFTLKMAILFTRLSTGLTVTDTHNGFRGFTVEALKKIHIDQNRMAHASEILSQIAHNKFKFCEIPVTIRYTDYSKKKGQSVFNSINILWDLLVGRDR